MKIRRGLVYDVMFADSNKKMVPVVMVYVPLEENEIEKMKNYDKEFEYEIKPRAFNTHLILELYLKDFDLRFFFLICPNYFPQFYQYFLNYEDREAEIIISIRSKEHMPIITFSVKYNSDFFKLVSFTKYLGREENVDTTGICEYCGVRLGG